MFISLLWTCAAGRVGSQASHCPDPEQRGCSLQKHQKTAGMFQEEGGAQAPKAPPLPTPLHNRTFCGEITIWLPSNNKFMYTCAHNTQKQILTCVQAFPGLYAFLYEERRGQTEFMIVIEPATELIVSHTYTHAPTQVHACTHTHSQFVKP